MPSASIIENAAIVAAGIALVVVGAVRAQPDTLAIGLALLGIKGGTYVADNRPSQPPPPPGA